MNYNYKQIYKENIKNSINIQQDFNNDHKQLRKYIENNLNIIKIQN